MRPFLLKDFYTNEYFGFDKDGYFKTVDYRQKFIMDDGDNRIRIYDGPFKNMYLGASYNKGYVMAYDEASRTVFNADLRPSSIMLDECEMFLYTDGYYYCSNRDRKTTTLFVAVFD
jgi:hypothetical protein